MKQCNFCKLHNEKQFGDFCNECREELELKGYSIKICICCNKEFVTEMNTGLCKECKKIRGVRLYANKNKNMYQ